MAKVRDLSNTKSKDLNPQQLGEKLGAYFFLGIMIYLAHALFTDIGKGVREWWKKRKQNKENSAYEAFVSAYEEYEKMIEIIRKKEEQKQEDLRIERARTKEKAEDLIGTLKYAEILRNSMETNLGSLSKEEWNAFIESNPNYLENIAHISLTCGDMLTSLTTMVKSHAFTPLFDGETGKIDREASNEKLMQFKTCLENECEKLGIKHNFDLLINYISKTFKGYSDLALKDNWVCDKEFHNYYTYDKFNPEHLKIHERLQELKSERIALTEKLNTANQIREAIKNGEDATKFNDGSYLDYDEVFREVKANDNERRNLKSLLREKDGYLYKKNYDIDVIISNRYAYTDPHEYLLKSMKDLKFKEGIMSNTLFERRNPELATQLAIDQMIYNKNTGLYESGLGMEEINFLKSSSKIEKEVFSFSNDFRHLLDESLDMTTLSKKERKEALKLESKMENILDILKAENEEKGTFGKLIDKPANEIAKCLFSFYIQKDAQQKMVEFKEHELTKNVSTEDFKKASKWYKGLDEKEKESIKAEMDLMSKARALDFITANPDRINDSIKKHGIKTEDEIVKYIIKTVNNSSAYLDESDINIKNLVKRHQMYEKGQEFENYFGDNPDDVLNYFSNKCSGKGIKVGEKEVALSKSFKKVYDNDKECRDIIDATSNEINIISANIIPLTQMAKADTGIDKINEQSEEIEVDSKEKVIEPELGI